MKTAINNLEQSRVVLYAQTLFGNREMTERLIGKDHFLTEEIKEAILKYPNDPNSPVEREVFGVLAWVQKYKEKK